MSTLPQSLVRFGPQFEAATRRHARHRRSLVRSGVAAALIVAVAVAAATVALVASDPPPASAIARAQAALTGGDGEILHFVERTTLTGPSGATETQRSETWDQNGAPYDHRHVLQDASGTPLREFGSVDGRPVSYDPRTNTLHIAAPGVEPSVGRGGANVAQRLVQSMRSLLASGRAHEAERLTVDGRAAIRIAADEDGTWLVVDAQTFRPIEWRSAVEGTGGVYDTAITHIEVYEWLPPTEANIGLLRSEAQHPGARVVADITIEGTDGPR